MSKRNLVNLVLLLIILVLLSLVIIEPGKEVEKLPPKLTGLNANDIHHIRITRHATSKLESEMEFEKTANGWVMSKPHSLPANPFRINSILELLSASSLSQNELAGLNKKTFGLDQPRATIYFNKQTSIIFGHNKSLKNHRYIQLGSTLHMIADTFFYQLAAKAESYINHKVIAADNKITRLNLPTLELTRSGVNWTSKPEQKKYGADSFNQLVSEWQLSQAFDIKLTEPQPGSKPDITIKLDNKKVIRFKIIGSTENFILFNIDTGIRYTLSKDRQEKLLQLNDIES